MGQKNSVLSLLKTAQELTEVVEATLVVTQQLTDGGVSVDLIERISKLMRDLTTKLDLITPQREAEDMEQAEFDLVNLNTFIADSIPDELLVAINCNGPSAKADGFALPFKRRALQAPLPRPVPPTPASGC
jgi:hypothetical protein